MVWGCGDRLLEFVTAGLDSLFLVDRKKLFAIVVIKNKQ